MKYLQHIIYTLFLLVFSSCGEDRTGEFYALIENRMWIEETMQQNYLWYEDMPAIESENDYFEQPAAFFKKLLSKEAMNGRGDTYSYMEERPTEEPEEARSLSLSRTSTYGIEFELVSDPLRTTTHTFARVLYVLPQSPAAEAGLKRGDWISAVNKQTLTSDNYAQLQQGGTVSLAIDEIVETAEGMAWKAKDTLSVGPSRWMEINPYLVDTLYQVENRKIAYLVYNEFSTGPSNKPEETEYIAQMKQIFSQWKAASPDAFILDLRYNSGGYLQCAQALGSLLAPEANFGKDFITLEYNNKAEQPKVSYPFESTFADANLNLSTLYVLTSAYTASASEALINGLIPYMGVDKVVLLGEKTHGKNVAMTSFVNDAYGLTLWPVVAYVLNVKDEGDFSNGFEPQYVLQDNNLLHPWYALGDVREFYLKNALSLITTGVVPDANATESQPENVYQRIFTRKIENIKVFN